MIKLFRAYALLCFSLSFGHDLNNSEYWYKEVDEIVRTVDLFGTKPEMMIWSNLVANNKDLEQREEGYKIAIKRIIELRIINRFKVLKQYHPIYNKN